MAHSQRTLLTQIEAEARRCRSIALTYFRSTALRVTRKADASPVTAADRLIEERLRAAIARLCPGESILGEEFGRSGSDSSTYWTVDPIDGTRAFSRGLPSWGILVGRVERGKAVLGVCDFPAIDVTLAVAPGVAAYLRAGRRTTALPRVRQIRALQDAVVFHGGMRWWAATPFAPALSRLMQACYLERAYGDCYGYLLALQGHADLVIDYSVHLWDLVPLAALAKASGRMLANFSGRESFTGPDTLMAHPSLVRLVARTLQSGRAI